MRLANGVGSVSWPMAGFGIFAVGPAGSSTRNLVFGLLMCPESNQLEA